MPLRTSPRYRLRPDEAERLLATGHDSVHPELSRLLAAVTAPPRPDELAGLAPALAAFEQAGRPERPVTDRSRRRLTRPIAAAAAVSVLLIGGAAVAAQTGDLPGTDPPAEQSLAPPENPSPAAPTSTTGDARRPALTFGPTATGHTTTPPHQTLRRLCRSWQDRHHKGKSIKPDKLRELAQAAGGQQRIPAFCAPLLRPPSPKPSPHGNPDAGAESKPVTKNKSAKNKDPDG